VNKTLADLIKISNTTGKDTALTQGGGGNTSVKTSNGKYMYIKASGTALKDMTARRGWRKLRIESVLEVIKDKTLAKLPAEIREPQVAIQLLLACDDSIKTKAKPSIESHLHALLDKYVIHLHPVAVSAYVNSKNGRKLLDKLLKNEKFPPLWVPYADPGFMLAKKMAKLIKNYQNQFGRKPAIIFLEKHGVVVNANTADSALRLVRKAIRICKSKLPRYSPPRTKPPAQQSIIAAKLAIQSALFNITGRLLPVTYFVNKSISTFMARKDAAKLLNKPALSPQELYYVDGPPVWLPRADVKTITGKLNSLVVQNRKFSTMFLIKNLGLFVAADEKKAATIAEIAIASLLIRSYAAGFGGITTLTKQQQEFINNLKSEA